MALSLPIFNRDPYNPYGTPTVSRKRLMIVGGVVAGVLLTIILALASLLTGNSKGDFVTMLGRQQALNKTLVDSQKFIKDEGLSKTNEEASLLFTTDALMLTKQLKAKFSQDPLDDATIKQIGDPTVADRLAKAKLLDKFDVTYRNILLQKLNQLVYSAPSIRDAVGGQEFKGVMNQYISDLQKIAAEVDKLNL